MVTLIHKKEKMAENAYLYSGSNYRTMKAALEHASVGDIVQWTEKGQRRWAAVVEYDLEVKGADHE